MKKDSTVDVETEKKEGLKRWCVLAMLILLFPVGVLAIDSGQRQLVTLDLHQCSVNELFKEIRKQTGLRFVYNEAYVKGLDKLNVRTHQKEVREVLEDVFRNTPYHCVLEGSVIYIAPRPVKPEPVNKEQAQPRSRVQGTVRGEKGEVMPGVSVIVEGTTVGVSTDKDGNYELLLPATKNIVLIYSFVGMQTVRMPWQGQSVLNIVLKEDRVALEDVVVIGYDTRKKGTVTGSVVALDGEKLSEMPVITLDQALQGQSAGVTALSNSGKPGEASHVTIRGINTLTAGSDPLWVIDGVVVAAGDFAALNNADIESVTQLKDASATSIYGSRAANGVILVTTKKGRFNQEARVNFRAQFGWSNLAYGKADVMTTQERLDYEQMIGYNDNKPGWRREDYEGINIDWKDVIYNNHAPMSSYDLSVSGGGEKIAYYFSAGYYTQEGTAPNSDFSRYSVKTSINGQFKPWLSGGATLALGYEKNTNITDASKEGIGNPANAAIFMLPYWNPYREDGTIAEKKDGSFIGDISNPLELYRGGAKHDNYIKLVGSLFLEVTPVKGLVLKSILGIDAGDKRGKNVGLPSYYSNNGNGYRSDAFMRQYTLTLTNTARYTVETGDHHFNILLGQEAIQAPSESFLATGTDLYYDRMLSLGVAGKPYDVDGSEQRYNYLSWFSRLSYNWSNRYFIDASVRGDGSSRFGADHRWGTFWSVGAMWKVKNESFLRDVQAVSDVQLSVSTGTSGNSQIGNYAHLALAEAGGDYAGNRVLIWSNIGNPNLTWEKLRDFNVGVKVGMWDRLNIDLQFYTKKTTDMLLMVPIPAQRGINMWMDNVGEMRNQGVEMTLEADIVKAGGFCWNFNGNAAYNKNKILSLYEGIDSYPVSGTGRVLKVGEDAGALQAVRFAGVNPANGDAMWYDKNGNLTNEYRTSDEVVLPGKSSNAPWVGGFTNTFSYKGIRLAVFFSWVKGRYMFNNSRQFLESNGDLVQYNQSPKMMQYWKKPGDRTEVPRYGVKSEADDRFVEDASFLRLKNISLMYDFPRRWMERTRVVEGLRVFAQAQNLLTFTKYKGMDPESPANISMGDYPQAKLFTFGVDLTF